MLRAPDQALTAEPSDVRSVALARLEALAAEEMLVGDAPSCVVVVEAGDPSDALSEVLGFHVLLSRVGECRFDEAGYSPTFEVIEEHPTLFELVFVFSDYGDGAIVIVPKEDGIDTELLSMCSMYSIPVREPHS